MRFVEAYRVMTVVSVLVLASWSDTYAQAQRTFVSAETGSDSNSCSRAFPCRNFAAAIAATAENGEVIVLDSGGYGVVSITQSVSLNAPPGVYAGVSVFSDIGISATPGSTGVVRIIGLTLKGLGGNFGIFSNGASLFIERCSFDGFVVGAVQVSGTSPKSYVTDSVFRQGLDHLQIYAGKAVVDRNRFDGGSGNAVIVLNSGTVAAVRDSVASNGNTAFFAAIGVNLTIENTTAVNNAGQAIQANGAVRLSRSTLMGNASAVQFSGGTVYSFGNNQIDDPIVGGTLTAVDLQ